MAANRYTTFLTIAGTDPTGGAGVLADVKTATVMGLYAMAAVTAVTAQNTLGVRGFRAVPLDMLADQLDCIFTDIPPDAVKVGMLPTAAHVRLVAEKMRQYKVKRLVVDPVMVATSGDSLTEGEVTGAMLDELLPLATVITPNLPEAETLVGRKLEGIYEMEKGARELGRRTQCGAVLLKGGHLEGDSLADVLVSPQGQLILNLHPRIETRNTHGTGCTLSSAIASNLARGEEIEQAVCEAISWLGNAIKAGADMQIGHGHGPVNHLYKG